MYIMKLFSSMLLSCSLRHLGSSCLRSSIVSRSSVRVSSLWTPSSHQQSCGWISGATKWRKSELEPSVCVSLQHTTVSRMSTAASSKAIEVEKKFSIPATGIEANILGLGGTLLHEKRFKDVYYDTRCSHLYLRDYWLRLRENTWELKAPVTPTVTAPVTPPVTPSKSTIDKYGQNIGITQDRSSAPNNGTTQDSSSALNNAEDTKSDVANENEVPLKRPGITTTYAEYEDLAEILHELRRVLPDDLGLLKNSTDDLEENVYNLDSTADNNDDSGTTTTPPKHSEASKEAEAEEVPGNGNATNLDDNDTKLQKSLLDEEWKNLTVDDLVNRHLVQIAEYVTERKTYRVGEYLVVLDQADFGYRLGEIEKVVYSADEVMDARNGIDELATRLGIDIAGPRVPGKIYMYLRQENPKLFAKLYSHPVKDGKMDI